MRFPSALEEYGFTTRKAPDRESIFVRRDRDGLEFEIDAIDFMDRGFEALLKPFDAHDAAQEVPSHWMAL